MKHTSHLGVYALILSDDKSAILVIKKSRGPYTGLYDLPGGSMEDGETLEQTLIREIAEETGCMVTSYDQIGALSCLYDYTKDNEPVRFRHVGVIYNAAITGTPNTHPDGHDSNGCVWLPLSNIDKESCAPLVNMAIEKNTK